MIRVLHVLVALVAAAIVASPAVAQNVRVRLEPVAVAAPIVPAGEPPYTFFNDVLTFRTGGGAFATITYAVYVDVENVSLGVLQLSYEWDEDDTLLFPLAGVPESTILFGPGGFMDLQSNVFVDPDSLMSPIVRGIDYAAENMRVPNADGSDLLGLIIFDLALDPGGYTADETHLFIRAGVLDAMNDMILDTMGVEPDFNGMPIMAGQNLSEAEIVVQTPEPGTGAMLLSGSGALLVLARRRERRRRASGGARA